jgi:hypothetical protein
MNVVEVVLGLRSCGYTYEQMVDEIEKWLIENT